MPDVEIKGRITVDTAAATKSTNDYIDAVRAARKAVNDAKIGSVEYKAAQEQLSKSTKELKDASDKTGGSFSRLKDTLAGAVPGFKGASDGAEGLNGKFKMLVANPIGLILAGIVLTLTFLYKAFTSTAAGGEKMEQVMAGIGAVAQALTDRFFALGNVAIKFFSGDFAGAAAGAKAAFTGLAASVQGAYKDTVAITARLKQLEKEQYADDLDKAKREKRQAFLKEALNDESVATKVKLGYANELRQDQITNAADDLKRTTEVAELKIKLLTRQTDGARKNQKEINELNIGIVRNQTENAQEMIRTNKVIANLEKQGNTERQQNNKEVEDRKKADLVNLRSFMEKSMDLDNGLKLSKLKDGLEKDLLVVNIGLSKQIAANKQAVQDRLLTQQQANELNEKLEQLAVDNRLQIQDKYNDDAIKKAKVLKEENEKLATDELNAVKALSLRKIEFELRLAVNNLSAQRRLLNEKQQLIENQYQADIKAAGDNATKKAQIDQKYTEDVAGLSDARKKINEAEANAKLETLSQIGGMFAQASELAGKSTIIGKGLAIAQTSIDTYVGAQKAYNSMIGIPVYGPILAPIAAGVAVAGGLANIKKIVSVQVPGKGSGGVSAPSMPSFSAPAPLLPQRASTALDSSAIQGIGNAANGGVNRSFVLDVDITNNQERAARISRAARLG